MEQHALGVKTAVAGVLAFFTALWGTLGWLVVTWVAAMALDYLSGSLTARKEGKWTSAAAREGLNHKGGMILFVLGATMLDVLLRLALQNMPVSLPFDYNLPICGLVLCWYIITEIGSLFENAEKLGANWPPFLKKILNMMREHFLGKASPTQNPEDEE